MMAKDLHTQHVLLQLLTPRECVGVAPRCRAWHAMLTCRATGRYGLARGRHLYGVHFGRLLGDNWSTKDRWECKLAVR